MLTFKPKATGHAVKLVSNISTKQVSIFSSYGNRYLSTLHVFMMWQFHAKSYWIMCLSWYFNDAFFIIVMILGSLWIQNINSLSGESEKMCEVGRRTKLRSPWNHDGFIIKELNFSCIISCMHAVKRVDMLRLALFLNWYLTF